MIIVEVDGATEDVQRELAWLCALMQSWYLSGPRLPQAWHTARCRRACLGEGRVVDRHC
jgi:hypothetical protein